MTASEVPSPLDSGMGTLAAAAGVAVGNRPALKVRFQHGAEGVMDNPVAERRGADGPTLGVAHLESEEGAGLVSPRGQSVLKRKQFVFQVKLEAGYGRAVPLAAGGAAVG